jgi:hypothetical protein
MASGSKERSTLTLDQVTVWREDLFDNRSLRISVEKLSEWPLGHYHGPPSCKRLIWIA